MTNKQYAVIAAIKTLLKALVTAGTLKFVGEYPDDINRIGQNFPAVLIKDGDETYEVITGRQMMVNFNIEIQLYGEIRAGIGRQQAMLDTQTAINNTLTKDLTMTNTCDMSRIINVQKGDVDNFNGYQGQLSQRTITYQVEYRDVRST